MVIRSFPSSLFFAACAMALSGCYAHWGSRVEADAAQWVRHADDACARGDLRAARTYLMRAWEIDGRGEERLDGELCPKGSDDNV